MAKKLSAIALGVALALPGVLFAQERQNGGQQRTSGGQNTNARPSGEQGRTAQRAQDHTQQDTRQETQGRANQYQPYYDSKHRDWHQWNDNEDRSYREYANKGHKQNQDFSKASERDRQQYWHYKRKHPDLH
jgi:hypothetical protein